MLIVTDTVTKNACLKIIKRTNPRERLINLLCLMRNNNTSQSEIVLKEKFTL